MKILILLLLTHEFQIVHNNILTVKTLQQSSVLPRNLNQQEYTKEQLRTCKNQPGDNIANLEECTNIFKQEYLVSGNHSKPRLYQMIREKEAMYVIICEQLQSCPEIEHYLTYQECRRLQRNQNVNDVKQRIWLKVFKKCERDIYPHQYQMCESNLKSVVPFRDGLQFYNEYCRYIYHHFKKVNTDTCGQQYPVYRHFIKYEYSNCLQILSSSNLLNSASCLANDFMYKFYKVPCRKEVSVPDDEFLSQCQDNIGFANIFRKKCLRRVKKRPLSEFLTFHSIDCGEGEKALMGHCHKKTKFMIDVMSWVTVVIVSIVGIGVFSQLIRSFFKTHTDRRKLIQVNEHPQSATGLLAKLAMNYKNLKIFNKKNKRKLLNFIKLDDDIKNKKKIHFARVLKEQDLDKPYSQYNVQDTKKFLQIAATEFIGLDKSVLKTLKPEVLKTVHKVLKKIRL